jgi:hypothetical protein
MRAQRSLSPNFSAIGLGQPDMESLPAHSEFDRMLVSTRRHGTANHRRACRPPVAALPRRRIDFDASARCPPSSESVRLAGAAARRVQKDYRYLLTAPTHRIEFRLEAFNALNHPNWGPRTVTRPADRSGS